MAKPKRSKVKIESIKLGLTVSCAKCTTFMPANTIAYRNIKNRSVYCSECK